MSHAEAVHTLQPAAGATAALVSFTGSLRYDGLPEEARHYARRHLLDTVGVMIAGAGGTIATQAENVIKAVRPAGKIPVPGRARRADLLDAAFLGGTAAHGIELDDLVGRDCGGLQGVHGFGVGHGVSSVWTKLTAYGGATAIPPRQGRVARAEAIAERESGGDCRALQ